MTNNREAPNPYLAPVEAVGPGGSARMEPLLTPEKAKRLLKIAKAQRVLCWTLLACIGLSFTFGFFLTQLQDGALYMIVGQIIVSLMQAMACGELVRSLGERTATATLIMLLCLVPFLGLILMLVYNQTAIKRLRAVRVRIGLMGARLSDMEVLRQWTLGPEPDAAAPPPPS